jgi:flagellar hook-associated protein 3 FlgL
MSYSLESIFNSASWAISNHSLALFKLQEQASTGQEINRPSDDSQQAYQILGLRDDVRSIEHYIDTMDIKLIPRLMTASIACQNITGMLADAKVAVTAASSTSGSSILAQQIDGLLESLMVQVNWTESGHNLFGGADSDTVPYAATRDSSGKIAMVTYQGSTGDRKVEVAPGVEYSAVLIGENLFKADDRLDPVFMSADDNGNTRTGLTVGSGTQTVRGDITLTVTDLGGGTFRLSIDGGTSTVDVTAASGDVALTNADTGEVLYVDTSGITAGGTEYIRVPGTYDIFNALINARDMLNNKDTMPASEWNSMLNATLGSMTTVQTNVSKSFPTIGGKIETLTTLSDSLKEIKFNAESEISQLQDADIAQVAVELAQHQILYEMSLSVAARLFSMSLMDFLQ